ncbi:MAG TPA: cobyric acid synthase [Aggregatilineaceae bacterium]|nr:cobyric acid synthase [Aggregatilineaceae bacterium]
MDKPRPIMIMGCTSDAGKSFLVTALCRYFANQGVRVAPFKAQNMSNNAAVTPDGLEIGRAQYLQAIAARVTPQARMNPVLLKPSADTYSQMIVLGKFDPEVTALPWLERRDRLWPVVCESLASLRADYDHVVIEGAGSPAEVNLRAGDIVNMAVALECGADVYLVADIDRGGSFAHLLGTWSCLEPGERALIRGFVLNKFRGDTALLGDAMAWLEARTGVPTVAIIPMVPHSLPEEDTLHHRAVPADDQINIALIAYPYASNLDEFDPLIDEDGVTVVPIHDFTSLDSYRAVILPGSKNTARSLEHLRETGLAAEISRAAARGTPILGICGGLQMLGRALHDPDDIENGDQIGLGLLDVETTLSPRKVTLQRTVRVIDGESYAVTGYEIHHGVTCAGPQARPHLADNLGWRQGNIWGIYLHGIMENTAYRQRLLARLGWQGRSRDWYALVDDQLNTLAEVISRSGWFKG